MTSTHKYVGIIILFMFFACTLEEPTLPTWFVEWRLPIPDPGFEVSEAINDSTIVDTTVNGVPIIAVSIKDSSERQQVSPSDLATKPDDDSLTQTIGDISLDSPPSEASDPITAEEILDTLDIQLTPGVQTDIREADVDAPTRYLVFKNFFRVVSVKEGFMQIQFFNNTFLNIRDSMTISIYDSASGDFLGDALFPQAINSKSSAVSQPVDLIGKTFTNILRFKATIPIAGETDYTPTEEDVISSLYFTATISEMKVAYANAIIPEQQFSEYDSTSVEDEEDKMISAKIDKGTFKLHVENCLPVEAYVTVKLLNFYSDATYSAESVFTRTYQMQAHNRDIKSVSVDGLYITNYKDGPTDDNSIITHFTYDAAVKTIPSDDYVKIYDEDSVIVRVEVVDSIYIEEFKGIIAPVDVSFDTNEHNGIIDDSERFEGSILFDELTMALNVYNELGTEILVDLNIVGYKNNRAESLRLEFDANPLFVNRREEGESVHDTTVLLDRTNSNIVEFVEFLPEDIVSEGNAVVNPDEKVGEVTKTDQVWSDYHIFSPFYLRIENDATYRSKIDSIDISEDVRDAVIKGNIPSASVNLNVYNGLPVGAKFVLSVATDSIYLFDKDSAVVIDDVEFTAGTDANGDGFVDDPFERTINFQLSPEEIEIFSNERIYIASQVLLDDTQGLVKLRQTDELRIPGRFKFRYRMNSK